MNVRLLRKIQKHILSEPKRIYMDDWKVFDPQREGLKTPVCGTVACISGWAAELSGDPNSPMFGEIFLKLGPEQADRLFMVSGWPTRFRLLLREAKEQTRAYARVVSDRIDHFIATKGAE